LIQRAFARLTSGTSAKRKPAVSSGFCEADEGARTLDLLHGKQTLYQLSYIRGRGGL
jgi:hypothetical protein